MNLRKFDYVYKDQNDMKHIACITHATIEPTYDFVIELNHKVYACIVDKLMSNEWRIEFFCGSDTSNDRTHIAELATLDDVFWNTESICREINDYATSRAIAQGIADIYHRFKGSY